MRDVGITGDVIRLGQLLKLAALVDAGAQSKSLLADGGVLVNGRVETRRGRQLVPGDVVQVGPSRLRVISGGDGQERPVRTGRA